MIRAKIYIENCFCGVLTEDSEAYHFQYDLEYIHNPNAKALSPTMPLSSDEYTKEFLFPVFDGLIPEGWLLNIAQKNWKIDQRDRMRLLLACCRDCIGNISVRSYEE